MADIKQAALWLKEGKKVHLTDQMPKGDFLLSNARSGEVDYYSKEERLPYFSDFHPDDFLSEEWEIYDGTN